MSYQIRYDSRGIAKYISRKKRKWNPWICLCFTILVIICLRYISGMDFKVTATALDAMAQQVKQGNSVQEAFSQFCLDVLQGAQIG